MPIRLLKETLEMATIKHSKKKIPATNIKDKLSLYYNSRQIKSIINSALHELNISYAIAYSPKDYLKICSKLKEFGGNISFCANLMIIESINSDTLEKNYHMEDKLLASG